MRIQTGDDVKKARLKLGLSQIQFGERLGVSRFTIIRYEGGKDVPKRSRMAIEQLMLHNRSKQ